MTPSFGDRLHEAVERTGSCICVGIDPRPEDFPPGLHPDVGSSRSHVADCIRKWAMTILSTLEGQVPVVKLQSACFEAWGHQGVSAFADVLTAAQVRGYLVIGDVKRSDIGSSAEFYAKAYLAPESPFCCDAITVNPYLGEDTLVPFVRAAEQSGRGLFVLCKTSNPGAQGLQNQVTEGGLRVFERVAEFIRGATRTTGARGYPCVGAVVGATHPEEGQRVRELLPDTWFLVPGYGAQGATAADLRGLLRAAGGGIIVNSSRGITGAWKKMEEGVSFSDSISRAVQAMREDLQPLQEASRG